MSWRVIGRAVGVGLAPFTAVAAVLLMIPGRLGVGNLPHGYELLGAFLLYVAVLSLIAGAWTLPPSPKPLTISAFMTLVGMPVMATGAISIALAVQGTLHGHYWLALLVLPGAGAILSPSRQPPPGAKKQPDDASLSPDAGHAPSVAEIKRDVLKAVAMFAPVAVSMWPLPVGIVVFHVLRALLLGPAPMPSQQIMAELKQGLPFIGYAMIFMLWFPASALLFGIVKRVRLRGIPDANRPLNVSETAKVEAACTATTAYADQARLTATTGIMPLATLGAYAVAAGLGALVVWGYQSITPQLPDMGELWFRAETDHILSVVVPVFAGVLAFMCGLPGLVLAQIWPRYAERAGWHYLVDYSYRSIFLPTAKSRPADGKPSGLIDRLLVLVRRHRLPDPFQADTFLRREGRRFPRPVAIILLVGAIASAYAIAHDWARADVIDRNGITITDDWTPFPRHYDFWQVRELTLRCVLDGSDVYTGIVLQLPGDDTIDLASGVFGGVDLADAVRIDDILRHQGTPVRFKVDAHGKPRYSAACVHVTAAQAQGVNRDIIIQIFHLDEWERRSNPPAAH